MLDETVAPELSPAKVDSSIVIGLDLIDEDPDQPRRTFNEESLRALGESIKCEGQLMAIAVQPHPHAAGRYMVVDGARRYRASRLAGLTAIRAEVRHGMDSNTVKVAQIVANLQREDLTLQDTIAGCAHLMDLIGLEAAAARTSMSPAWVSQRAGIMKLDQRVRDLVLDGKLDDVEVAHLIHQAIELDKEEGEDLLKWAKEDPEQSYNGALTRAKAREALKELKQMLERRKRRDADEARRKALEEKEAKRKKALKDATAGGKKPSAEQMALVPPPPKNESKWDREKREQAEAWLAVEPEIRRIARENKKLIGAALLELLGKPESGFEFHVGMPDFYTSRNPPAKAINGDLKLEVRGTSKDAGLMLDAIAPEHEISISMRVPIAKLREVEAIVGKPLPIREFMSVKASLIAKAEKEIRRIHAERKSATPAKVSTNDGKAGAGGITAFIAAAVTKGTGNVTAADFYTAYCKWAKAKGHTPLALRDNKYAAAITAAGVQKKRLETGFVYLAIKLTA